MTLNSSSHADLVRKVVRGERPWTDIRLIGATVREHAGVWEIGYKGKICSTPDLNDIVAGLRAYMDRPTDMREWAHVLLGGSGFVDFAGLDSTEAGEVLVEALWEAAESGAVNQRTKALMARLMPD